MGGGYSGAIEELQQGFVWKPVVAGIVMGESDDGPVFGCDGRGDKVLTESCTLCNPGEGVGRVRGWWKKWKTSERGGVGRGDGVEKHGGEGGGKVAGLNASGNEGSCNPDEGGGRSDGIAKSLVVCVVVGMKEERLAEPEGSGE